jgi:hypothetical protein
MAARQAFASCLPACLAWVYTWWARAGYASAPFSVMATGELFFVTALAFALLDGFLKT